MDLPKLEDFDILKELKRDDNKKILYLLGNKKNQEKKLINQAIIKLEKTNFEEIKLFHNLELKNFHINPPYYKYFSNLKKEKVIIEIIYPINKYILNKYSAKKFYNFTETSLFYKNFVKEEYNLKKKINWIEAIERGEKEQEKLIFQNKDFSLLYDYKFNSEKKNNLENLHLLCIFKNKNLLSIRDLSKKNLNMLKEVKKIILKICQEKFFFEKKDLNLFFHYPPTFFRLHLHIICNENNKEDVKADRAHFLNNIISNLEKFENYYELSDIAIRLNSEQIEFYEKKTIK